MALSPVVTPPVAPPVRLTLVEPTDRYAHGVLGDAIEWGAIRGTTPDGETAFTYSLPPDRVFEDIDLRIARLGDDPHDHRANKAVVVESRLDLGARLSVYGFDAKGIRLIAATPFIGQRNRWLAPAGIGDFDGDGFNDIAYVETPHLSGTLKVVTLRGDTLVPVAAPKSGFSNHRIGQDFITSGVRECHGTVELLLPDLSHRTLMAVRVRNGEILSRPLPFHPNRGGIERARECGEW